MKVKHIAVACTALIVSSFVYAFDKNDCILNGMKGVANETAAREIQKACRQKSQDEKRKILDQVLKEYGDVTDEDLLARETNANSGEVQYRNNSDDKVITFVRLAVWPVSDNPVLLCKSEAMHAYNYRLTLKPGKTVNFSYPSRATTDCVKTWVVFGREGSWKDVSLLSSATPSDSIPFDEKVFNFSLLFGPTPSVPTLPAAGTSKSKDGTTSSDMAGFFSGMDRTNNRSKKAGTSSTSALQGPSQNKKWKEYVDPMPSVALEYNRSLERAMRESQ